jgi:hypothetical protein
VRCPLHSVGTNTPCKDCVFHAAQGIYFVAEGGIEEVRAINASGGGSPEAFVCQVVERCVPSAGTVCSNPKDFTYSTLGVLHNTL